MKLTRESIVLIALCIVDLVSTLVLLRTDRASEGNPVMAFYLHYGVGTFVLAKLTLIFLPVFIAEWSRQYRPRFVKFAMRSAIMAYAGIYLMLFLTINVGAEPKDVNPAGSVQATQSASVRTQPLP